MSLAVRFELVAQRELRQAVTHPSRWPEVEEGVRLSPVPRWRMYSL